MWRHGFWFVAGHGITDVTEGPLIDVVLSYSVSSILPIQAVDVLFGPVSLFHFAQDCGGSIVSFVVHLCVMLMWLIAGATYAFDVIMIYLVFWHVPFHVYRVQVSSKVLYAIFTLLLFTNAPTITQLNDWMRRLVVGHVFCTHLRLRSSSQKIRNESD